MRASASSNVHPRRGVCPRDHAGNARARRSRAARAGFWHAFSNAITEHPELRARLENLLDYWRRREVVASNGDEAGASET